MGSGGTRGAVEEKKHHHRRSATEASVSATWTSGTDMEPRYHRPCSDLRRYALARVHRNQRNGAKQQALMHAGRSCIPCRAEASTHRGHEARPSHSVLCGPTSTLASTSRRIRFNLAKRKHTHTEEDSLVSFVFGFFLLCFSWFSSAASFLVSFLCFVFCFSPVCFCFVLFCFRFCFGWALDTHAMDRRFHKNERRQRRREEPSGGSVEARPRAHEGAMANQSTTDEPRSHGITVSAYPATSATQRRERCERECCSSSAGTRRLGETVERPVGKRRVVSTRVECSKGTRHSNRERA